MARNPEYKKSFIQKFIRELRSVPLLPRRLLVATSGGVDSVALALALKEVERLFKLEVTLAHVHHGISKGQAQNEFRHRAQREVRALSGRLGWDFITNEAENSELNSEAELRRYRYDLLTGWQRERNLEALVLGHHFEDLLETQVMRLMRGSSQLGLGAMTVLSPQKRMRPFLNFKKEELVQFVQFMGFSWVSDPSNEELKPLRNHVRQWLKQMDEVHPGATENLSKSLQRIANLSLAVERPWKNQVLTKGGIRRSVYLTLPQPLKAELLAEFIRIHGVKEYTSGQIHELIKRLDVSQKETRFKFLGRDWTLHTELIQITE